MNKLDKALIEFAETQNALYEALLKIIDVAKEGKESIEKIEEAKKGLNEFFDKYDEYHYQRYGGSFRKMFNSPK